MRPFLPFVFLLSFSIPTFCQVQQISLHDGSILKGTIEGVTADSTLKIRLRDSSLLEIPIDLIWRVSKNRRDFQHLPGGNGKVLSRGRYSTVSMHVLTAKTFDEDFGVERQRWGMGFHFSTGYQFSPGLAVGGGIGLDITDQFYSPVFAEARGAFFRKNEAFRQVKSKQKQDLRWMGGYFEIQPDQSVPPSLTTTRQEKQRIAFCYSFQAGIYFPWNEIFNDNEFVETKLGLLFYPALGFAFPSANGTTFQVDFGYKFQRHVVHSTFPWDNFEIIETFHLNSFAMRTSWTF